MNRAGVLVACVLLVSLLAACGGSTPQPTSTPSATPTATLPAGPRPTSTPLPQPVEPLPSGRVNTRFSVSCGLGDYGLEVRIGYNVQVLDTPDLKATITRVRVYVDGLLREDTGQISSRAVARQVTYGGLPNRLYTIQLHIDTWAAPQPSDFIEFAHCPSVSDAPAT